MENLNSVELKDKQPVISMDKYDLASAIEHGVEKGINKAMDDITKHFKKQTKLFMFVLSGILLMLAVIAIVLSSYHGMPVPQ